MNLIQPIIWDGSQKGRSAETHGGAIHEEKEEGFHDTWKEKEIESEFIFANFALID